MDIKKLLMGGIVGSILYFGLGYLVYGNLMANFMQANPGTATGVDRAMEDFQFLYLTLGNIAMGFLLAYIFVKGSINSMAGGLVSGGIIGFLYALSFDTILYGTTNIISKTAMAADICAFTIISAIVGAVVGMVLGRGNSAV